MGFYFICTTRCNKRKMYFNDEDVFFQFNSKSSRQVSLLADNIAYFFLDKIIVVAMRIFQVGFAANHDDEKVDCVPDKDQRKNDSQASNNHIGFLNVAQILTISRRHDIDRRFFVLQTVEGLHYGKGRKRTFNQDGPNNDGSGCGQSVH